MEPQPPLPGKLGLASLPGLPGPSKWQNTAGRWGKGVDLDSQPPIGGGRRSGWGGDANILEDKPEGTHGAKTQLSLAPAPSPGGPTGPSQESG